MNGRSPLNRVQAVLSSALILSLSFFALPATATESAAWAQEQLKAEKALHHTAEDIINELRTVAPSDSSQMALNALIATAISELSAAGHEAQAAIYADEWERRFSKYFTENHLMDLGDHLPLNQWLADFYQDLQKKLGGDLSKFSFLHDIHLMNFATPVTLQPAGDRRNGETWSRIEYRKHFIPFSQVLTYWGALVACRHALKEDAQAAKKLCPSLARKARQVMGRHVAPSLSDAVYQKANSESQAPEPEYDWEALFRRTRS